MKIRSYAKLNLFLHILGKRDNGYHELNSLFSFIDLYDEINFVSGNFSQDNLFISGEYGNLLSVEDNLIIRTIKLFHEFYQIKQKDFFEINLTKNLPVAAGIGGGSSNAACILYGLHKFYGIPFKNNNLAVKIGADVPFFCNSNSRYISGVGEIMDDIVELPEMDLLLVNPGEEVLTAGIFKNLKQYSKLKPNLKSWKNDDEFIDYLLQQSNDLQNIAIKLCPKISEVINLLQEQSGIRLARMTGSGATCFAFFDDKILLDKAFRELQSLKPNWYIRKTKLLNQGMIA